jgi:hypothetical protein
MGTRWLFRIIECLDRREFSASRGQNGNRWKRLRLIGALQMVCLACDGLSSMGGGVWKQLNHRSYRSYIMRGSGGTGPWGPTWDPSSWETWKHVTEGFLKCLYFLAVPPPLCSWEPSCCIREDIQASVLPRSSWFLSWDNWWCLLGSRGETVRGPLWMLLSLGAFGQYYYRYSRTHFFLDYSFPPWLHFSLGFMWLLILLPSVLLPPLFSSWDVYVVSSTINKRLNVFSLLLLLQGPPCMYVLSCMRAYNTYTCTCVSYSVG